jgi:hypothetical protein
LGYGHEGATVTRQEFIRQAAAAGKSKEDTKKAFDYLEKAGRFDDDETTPVPETSSIAMKPEKPNFGQRAGQNLSEEFAPETETLKSGVRRVVDVAKTVEEPTVLGEAARRAAGGEGVAATVAESLASRPERALRMVGTVGTAYGAAAEVAATTVNETLKDLTFGKVDAGAALEKLMGVVGDKLSGNPLLQKLVGNYKELPEAVKDDVKAALGATELVGLEKAGGSTVRKAAQKGAKKVAAVPAKPIGRGLEKAAARIEGVKVPVKSPEFKKGAMNKLYAKYGVFGNAKQVQEQWQGNIKQVYDQVKQQIAKNSGDPNNYVSLSDVFDKAEKILTEGKSGTTKLALKRRLKKVEAEFLEAHPQGHINLADAQLEKQAVGRKGDWHAKNGKITSNPDASETSAAYNAAYYALKKELEAKGGPGIKELNKALSEMIPMERAASKQILLAGRKSIIPLDVYLGGLSTAASVVSGNPLPAAVAVANVATKSPTVAKGLYKTGRKLQGKPTKPSIFNP